MTDKKIEEKEENLKAPETFKMRFDSWWLDVCFKRGWKKRGRTNAKT